MCSGNGHDANKTSDIGRLTVYTVYCENSKQRLKRALNRPGISGIHLSYV